MPNHPTTELLSDEQVAEIETVNQGCCYPYVDDLIQTVRALRADNEKWQRAAGHWKAQHEKIEEANTALREQLAEAQEELRRLKEKWAEV